MCITEGLYEYLGAFVDTLYGVESKWALKINVVRSGLPPAMNGVQSGAAGIGLNVRGGECGVFGNGDSEGGKYMVWLACGHVQWKVGCW